MAVLFAADAALDDGCDGLEVARVEGQGEVHRVALLGGVLAEVAHVVLHVAGADALPGVALFELGEHVGDGLAEDVHEHVEAAAVGHTEDDLADAEFGALLDHAVELGDHRLGAGDGEAFGADELAVQEFVDALDAGHLIEQALLLGDRRDLAVLAGLHAGLQPGALLEIGDVPVFDADVAAVGVLQARPDLAQRGVAAGHEQARVEAAVHVFFGEAEVGGVEGGGGGLARAAERVDGGGHVPVEAVALDELVDARLERELLDLLGVASGFAWGFGGGFAWGFGGGFGGGFGASAEVTEHRDPLRVDRVRVALIGLVEGLEEREVVPAERGLDIHGRAAVYSFAGG